MAHTSDRTLLASLGFADPDKGDRRHTLACQYLCQPATAARLWARVRPSVLPPPAAADLRPAMEIAISKDRGFLIGFWDVTIVAMEPGKEYRECYTGWPPVARITPLYIEVKARHVDVASIARQIETYQSGMRERGPVLVVTCYPMPSADRAVLTAKNIAHVHLGPDFVRYCQDRDNEAPDESDAF